MKFLIQRKLMTVYMGWEFVKLMIHYPFHKQRIEKEQKKKLQKLMKHAYTIPFYKERFDRAGVKPEDIQCAEDLRKLPPLTKAEYRDYINTEVARNKERYKHWIKDGTSGTTGMPLTIYLTPKEKALYNVKWLRVLKANHYHIIRGKTFCIVSPHRKANAQSIIQKFGICRRDFVTQIDEASFMVEKFNESKPDLFYSNKSQIVLMCLYAEKQGIILFQPEIVSSVAETMDDASYALFEKHFGKGKLFQSYGCTETGTMAFQVKEKPDRYIWSYDTNAFFVADENMKPSDHGKIYITSLYQYGFPLINYDIGDVVDTFVEDGIRYISDIKGRVDDWLKFSDGELLPFHYPYELMEHIEGIAQFRFIQKDYTNIHIMLVHQKNTTKTKEEIERQILKEVHELIKYDITYEIEWLDIIKPDPSGKIRMVVSEIKD